MNEINELVKISKYAGERFDLVQAGGGNSSVKFDNGEMVIKASGFLLSDVTSINGYSRVTTEAISKIVKEESVICAESKRKREQVTSKLVNEATLDKINRPSIETLLHSFLLKYTLHTHPVVVNMIVIKENWKTILSGIFKDDEIAFVEYQTPGIELALNLSKELENINFIPKIIFLQNHGLIVTSNDALEIESLTEYVLEKIEIYLQIDMKQYKLTNKISLLLKNVEENESITYLSEDAYLNTQLVENIEQFFTTPFCPDSLVFCGVGAVEIKSLDDIESLKLYKEKYFELPKVIVYQKKIFFIASNIKKAKEMEEVFKFHVMVLVQNKAEQINFLENQELAYLSNWEAEKYRQKI